MMPTRYGPITLAPLTGVLGAEVSGVSVGPLDPELLGHLNEAWTDWKVLFFRDQSAGPEEHLEFARQFGELEVHPFLPHGDHEELVVLDSHGPGPSNAERWHTDVTFRAAPPDGSVLRACIVPEFGGDTLWSDMEDAYECLDDDTKAQIEHLTATHSMRHRFGRRLSSEELERKLEEFPDQHHPVVRIHPVSGRRSLFVNASFTVGIDEIDPDVGGPLLVRLLHEVHLPTRQVRFRWRPGSIAMWDNRNTQHCATQDFGTARRRMERATLLGSQPEGPPR
ncbi:MAG: TauD/TfdA family dioxygenase [Ilumatobacteraceae bacterium]